MADGFLFPPEEYTDETVRAIMQGNTCRQCAHRQVFHQGTDQHVKVFVCDAHKSGQSRSGWLRVRSNQPACILFTHKNNAQ
jgi:hypothetical protein